ncbi:MAG: PfkB family carbohydrate kinase [Isosphaeraceae bacterium]|nr:PfkB family carbohydrate kinase [Isosphaeraceae bacterium]
MIISVTLNPCLDKTLSVPDWRPGDNVRGTAIREVVGGKGNNVARALRRLGRSVRPATFLGGSVGRRCAELLHEVDRFDPLIVHTKSTTREIHTVRSADDAQTAFFDPDPAIEEHESEALVRSIESALNQGGVEALTLSGSSPSPATHGVFEELIALGRSRRVPVFLDTYGPALAAIWGFHPDAMQLNRREAAQAMGRATVDDAAVVGLLSEWSRRRVALGVVTDGPGAVLAMVEGRLFRAIPPAIRAVNPIGSGDCFLAGLVDARLDRLDPEATLRRGVAAATANALVWDAGAIERSEVERLEPAVIVEPI